MADGFLRIVIIVLNEQPWAAATYRHQVPMNARLSVFLFRSYVGLSRNEHSRVEMYLNAIQKEHTVQDTINIIQEIFINKIFINPTESIFTSHKNEIKFDHTK